MEVGVTMNICLINFGQVINSVGGAEKVLVDLANGFVEKGNKVTIIVCENKNGFPYYKLNDNVNFINLRVEQKINFPLRVIRKICKLSNVDYGYFFNIDEIDCKLKYWLDKEKYDVLINFFPHHLNYILCNKPKNVPVVQMLHGSIDWLDRFSGMNKDKTIINRMQEVNCVQVLMQSYVSLLENRISVPVKFIPNIVPNMIESNYRKKVVLLARFDKLQKRNHLLIDAYSKIAHLFQEWELHVYGMKYTDGYVEKCEKLIQKYGLESKCYLHDPVQNVNDVLKEAAIFALPSSFEGFPLALTEAMSAGVPCVAFKTCAGVNELIVDGYNGFLSEDSIDDFADKLKFLMMDINLCKSMGANAKESVKQYSKDAVVGEWIKLINNVIKCE